MATFTLDSSQDAHNIADFLEANRDAYVDHIADSMDWERDQAEEIAEVNIEELRACKD